MRRRKEKSTRVGAFIFLSGKTFYLRFDDEVRYNAFKTKVDMRLATLQVVYGQDNTKLFVRPSSVDAISAPRPI